MEFVLRFQSLIINLALPIEKFISAIFPYFCPYSNLFLVDSFFDVDEEDRMKIFNNDDETDQKSAIFNGNDCNDPNMNIHPYL